MEVTWQSHGPAPPAVAPDAPVESTALTRDFKRFVSLPLSSGQRCPEVLIDQHMQLENRGWLLQVLQASRGRVSDLPCCSHPLQAAYAPVEVFKTDMKGWGLRAITSIGRWAGQRVCLFHMHVYLFV